MMIGATVLLLTFAVLLTTALAEPTKGVVKWYNAEKGMGFLTIADGTGKDIFVDKSAISGSCNGTLHEGQTVSFDIVLRGGQGQRIAANVTCK